MSLTSASDKLLRFPSRCTISVRLQLRLRRCSLDDGIDDTRVTVNALREASVIVNHRPQDNPQLDAREVSVLFCEIARELEHSASYGSAA